MGLAVTALVAAPSAWADHVRIVVGQPPAAGAQGLLIAGRGKTVSGEDAARVLAKVPKGRCPCPITIYLTLPRERVHNVRRYRIAIVGGGYHGLLVSDRTKVPGLVSIYDLEPTVKALDRGEKPPLTSRPDANPEVTLMKLDRRLTEAHDSRGAAAYVVFGLVALFALLALALRSAFWGRAALVAGPVALAAALALSGLDVARPRSVGLALLVVVGLAAPGLAAVTRSRLALAAALLAVFAVYAGVLAFSTETSSLAALGPHPDGGVRFYGISNQVETLLLVPGLLGGALLGVGLLPLVAVCVLVVVGASGLGADGGGVLVFAAGYLFLWLRLRGVALTGRNLVARGRGGDRGGAAPRRPRRCRRRLEPRHAHDRRRPGCARRRARTPLAGLARRLRRRLAGDGDHHLLAARARLGRSAAPPLRDGRRGPRRPRRVPARERFSARRRGLRRPLVRGAALLGRDPARSVDSPHMARALLIALAVLLVAGCGGEKTVEPTGPVVGTLPKAGKANPAAGKKVFADNGCSGCHTFQPAGATGSIGPDLDKVLKGKDAEFIKASITDPNAEIASGFQPNIMPQGYGSQLTSQQINDLVAFLQTG